MFRLIKVGDFLSEVSANPRLKFDLAGLTFAGLVVPTALLMSIGVPEQYALPLMLVMILPFQYTAFCFIVRQKVRSPLPRLLLIRKALVLYGIIGSLGRATSAIFRRSHN
jgi:hypothetical protein